MTEKMLKKEIRVLRTMMADSITECLDDETKTREVVVEYLDKYSAETEDYIKNWAEACLKSGQPDPEKEKEAVEDSTNFYFMDIIGQYVTMKRAAREGFYHPEFDYQWCYFSRDRFRDAQEHSWVEGDPYKHTETEGYDVIGIPLSGDDRTARGWKMEDIDKNIIDRGVKLGNTKKEEA